MAFTAADMAFRHPHLFRKLVAFSGRYDLTLNVEHFDDLLSGHYDQDIYFHSPTHYLPNLEDRWYLDPLRRMEIVLVIGAEDPFLENNRQLSRILHSKGIEHQFQIWSGRAHSARAWRLMAPLYL